VNPVRWGVLGAANIAVAQVIPAMQQGRLSRVVAIASRSPEKSREAAQALGIARAHGSYAALREDPEVEAIYNPLPNHLHVPWSIRAVEAGRHVLCEKPIALTVTQAEELRDAATRTGVLVGEAFMVRSHAVLRQEFVDSNASLARRASYPRQFPSREGSLTITKRRRIAGYVRTRSLSQWSSRILSMCSPFTTYTPAIRSSKGTDIARPSRTRHAGLGEASVLRHAWKADGCSPRWQATATRLQGQ
jgi:hypothetical protein